MQRWIVMLALLGLTACAIEPSYQAQQVQPAYPPMVADCTYLGGVAGVSKIPWLNQGQQAARYQALDEAAKLGATHVVWTQAHSGFQASARGHAYRCMH